MTEPKKLSNMSADEIVEMLVKQMQGPTNEQDYAMDVLQKEGNMTPDEAMEMLSLLTTLAKPVHEFMHTVGEGILKIAHEHGLSPKQTVAFYETAPTIADCVNHVLESHHNFVRDAQGKAREN